LWTAPRRGASDDHGITSPYDGESSLAGGGSVGGIGSGLVAQDDSLLGGKSGAPNNGTGFGSSVAGSSGHRLGGDHGFPGGSSNQGGVLSPGHTREKEEQNRERRYFLKEDRDVWGAPDVLPAVLYGEHRPPALEVDEDDDDF